MTEPIPGLPPGTDQAPLGGAIQNIIDGNETVAVGTACATIFYTLLGLGLAKEWVDPIVASYLLLLAVPITVVAGAIIRSKVWAKDAVAEEVAKAKAGA